MPDLNRLQREILDALGDGPGGFTTRDLARRAPQLSSDPRRNSQFLRQELLALERLGFVQRMDDQKPTCWQRATSNAPKGPNA